MSLLLLPRETLNGRQAHHAFVTVGEHGSTLMLGRSVLEFKLGENLFIPLFFFLKSPPVSPSEHFRMHQKLYYKILKTPKRLKII